MMYSKVVVPWSAFDPGGSTVEATDGPEVVPSGVEMVTVRCASVVPIKSPTTFKVGPSPVGTNAPLRSSSSEVNNSSNSTNA